MNITKIRIKKGLSQTELAKKAGVKAQAVHNVESRGIKKIDTAKRYAAALNCSWIELIDD